MTLKSLLVPSLLLTTAWLTCGAETARTYHCSRMEVADTVMHFPINDDGRGTLIEARAGIVGLKERQGLSKGAWGLEWSDGLRLELRTGNTAYADPTDVRYMRIRATRADSVLFDKTFSKAFEAEPDKANTIIVDRRPDGTVTLAGGRRVPEKLGSFHAPVAAPLTRVSLFAEGKVSVRGAVSEYEKDNARALQTPHTLETLKERFRESKDAKEGFWQYFDRENNPEYARMGGRYTIATVAEPDGSYTIIYIDGAQVKGAEWRPGMMKGKLVPTIFAGQFDLEWVDAEMVTMTRDINARIEQDALLTVEFPLLKTRMRFSKMPRKLWDN